MLYYSLWRDTQKLTTGTYAKFDPSMLTPGTKTLSLCTARNMQPAFQLVLCADTPWALTVDESLWLSQKNGVTCYRVSAPKEISLYIEGMQPEGDGYFRADALLDAQTTEQQPNRPAAVYCEIDLPKDIAPGVYIFPLELFSRRRFEDEVSVGKVEVTLKVYAYTLPDPSEYKFYLDLWQHNSKIARAHGVPLWSDAHFAVLEPYVRSLGALGQKAVTLVLSEAPWGGQSCFREYRMEANLYEYSILPLKKGADGVLRADFTPMQRYIDLCAEYGIRDELSLYGLMNVWCTEGTDFVRLAEDDPDALRVRYLDEATGAYRFLRSERELEEYLRLIFDYFEQTNQLDRVRIAADEPGDIERYRASMQRILKICPTVKCKAAINHAEFIEEFEHEITDFVPYSGHLFTHLELLRRYRETMPGKRFLWYTCCCPHWPNTFLKNDLCDALMIGVFTSFFRFDGYLRWAYTEWNDHPNTDARYGDFANGDTHFVYPSPSGTPMLSLRWKALRKGIWLYELLERLRAEKGDEAAEEMIDRVLFDRQTELYYTDGHHADSVYCHNGEAFESLFDGILDIIS